MRTHGPLLHRARIQDWDRSTESLPQLNHRSLEYQDCHSCSAGPFLETKQVCMALSHLGSPHIIRQVRLGRHLCFLDLSVRQAWSCTSHGVVTAFELVCNNTSTPISRSPVPFIRPGKFYKASLKLGTIDGKKDPKLGYQSPSCWPRRLCREGQGSKEGRTPHQGHGSLV